MRLENLLALTQGTLQNQPFVTRFDGISFDAKKVKRGNLFIAFNNSDIDEAILHGAYGIIFDKPTQITDNEIAWIKVGDVNDTLMRLLRFHLIEKELDVYETDLITIKLAQQIMTDSNFLVLGKSIKDDFMRLWDVPQKAKILYCPKLIDRDTFVTSKILPNSYKDEVTIVEQTLFETSFIFNDIFYERQLLSPFFISYLERLLNFYKMNEINYRLRSFTPIDNFEAVFTNKDLSIKEFGASDRVLIFEPDFELIHSQISFLKRQANWAKIIYVLPMAKAHPFENIEDIFTYESQQDIIKVLKSTPFHFALIAEQDRTLLENSELSRATEQLTLF
jgi:ferrochelatase